MNINQQATEFFNNPEIRKQAIADLAEIIAIPSVAGEAEGIYPYGKACAMALDKAAELAEKYGFRYENHDYHCMSILYGDAEQEIGIVCHLDVVPAGDDWSTDPFQLVIKDNLLMGRGTHDDKGPFIQSLYTLRFFKENDIKLPFTVRIILGSDEEVGSTDLEHFVKVCKPPMFSFTPDSEFPVCIGEKSILSLELELEGIPQEIKTIEGGTVTNAVPGKAFARIKTHKKLESCENITVTKCDKCENGYKIEAVGKAAHAAMPESGVNAINLLLSYLTENGIDSENGILDYLKTATSDYLGKNLGIDAENKDFGYLTCVGSVIKTQENKVTQYFNIRHLPETPYNEIANKIADSAKAFNGKIKVTVQSDGYFVSADDEKIKALTKACEEVLGIECKPYTMGGGTYARWLPNTVAFGSGIVSERNHLGSEKGNAHQRDEYISEKEFFMGMEIYSRALGNLSNIF